MVVVVLVLLLLLLLLRAAAGATVAEDLLALPAVRADGAACAAVGRVAAEIGADVAAIGQPGRAFRSSQAPAGATTTGGHATGAGRADGTAFAAVRGVVGKIDARATAVSLIPRACRGGLTGSREAGRVRPRARFAELAARAAVCNSTRVGAVGAVTGRRAALSSRIARRLSRLLNITPRAGVTYDTAEATVARTIGLALSAELSNRRIGTATGRARLANATCIVRNTRRITRTNRGVKGVFYATGAYAAYGGVGRYGSNNNSSIRVTALAFSQ